MLAGESAGPVDFARCPSIHEAPRCQPPSRTWSCRADLTTGGGAGHLNLVGGSRDGRCLECHRGAGLFEQQRRAVRRDVAGDSLCQGLGNGLGVVWCGGGVEDLVRGLLRAARENNAIARSFNAS